MAEPPAPLLLALFEPDIVQNTGAMMRTCACLGVDAAIIEPAGFRINDSRFRRGGMDYLDALTIKTHDSWADFAAWRASCQRRLVLLTTKGPTCLWDFAFCEGDIILVGRSPPEFPPRSARRPTSGSTFPFGLGCVPSMWGSPRQSPSPKRCASSIACPQ